MSPKNRNLGESSKTLKKKLWKIFSEYIRTRDLKDGCISCGKRVASIKEAHAGHYYSRGACPQPPMFFDEMNVNLQCVRCNAFLEGNKQGYRAGLVKKYGEQIIQRLELKKTLKTQIWKNFEYQAMIALYTTKLKQLKE